MKLSQVALQLYTLRDFCKTAEDFAASMKKVRAIGYTAIQVSGVGPIAPEEIARIAAGEGLTICATHEGAQTILDNPQSVVERLKALGCLHTAYPHPAGIDLAVSGEASKLAAALNASGKVLADAGLTLSYHNHANEFMRVDGKVVLDTLYDETDPAYLKAELDTYWVQYGGGNPVSWCEKMRGRMPLLHLKDYKFTPENKPAFCEVGNGTLEFAKIVAAAEASGCEWFIVEQDTCPGDPFDSIKQSFDYIKANLIAA